MIAYGSRHPRILATVLAAAGALAPAVAAAPAPAEASGCVRYALQGLLPGMTDGDVRQVMGGGGSLSQVIDPAAGEISVRTYGALASSAYVVFDRRIGRGEDAHVARVRVGFVSTRANLDALVARMGPPAAGADGLAPGLPGGPVVWVDRDCDLAVTAYRRQESWWSGDVGTFLQVERIEDAKKAGSPGAAAIAAIAVAEPPALKLQITSEPPAPDPAATAAAAAATPEETRPAQRVHYVAPVYPPSAKWLKTVGHVRLSIVVREDGSVGDVRVLDVVPVGHGFEEAATAAAKRWKYDPATRAGHPVQSEQVVVLDFR